MTEMRPDGLLAFDVVLVRWPDEFDRIERLRTLGVPRLLLVGEDLSTLEPGDALEDWIRLAAPEDELRIRVATLASPAPEAREKPTVDEGGLRRRIAPPGLEICTVRGRGYIFQSVDASGVG